MSLIYDTTHDPVGDLVWANGETLLGGEDYDRLVDQIGKAVVLAIPSDATMADLTNARGALAAFILAFPEKTFQAMGAEFDEEDIMGLSSDIVF